jgi:c-di-GMP-related signal transduction protein
MDIFGPDFTRKDMETIVSALEMFKDCGNTLKKAKQELSDIIQIEEQIEREEKEEDEKSEEEKEFEALARDQAEELYGDLGDPYMIEKHVDMVLGRGKYADE